jgi:hypothetical protein
MINYDQQGKIDVLVPGQGVATSIDLGIVLPEWLFDLDCPGHYMRRLKNVSLSIPSVTGPYTSVNCTLTLLGSKIRRDPNARQAYREQTDEENPGFDAPRFEYRHGARSSIATSHGRSDAGLFEFNFRDERYLPFEGEGAISRWRIELPRETNTFDVDSLSDVVFHMNYTARDGGALLKNKVLEEVVTVLPKAGLERLFSARHEFPDAWHRFLHPGDIATEHVLDLDLTEERFPISFRNLKIELNRIEVFLTLSEGIAYVGGKDLHIEVDPDPSGEDTHALSLHSTLEVPHVQVFNDAQEAVGILTVTVPETEVAGVHQALRKKLTIDDGPGRWRLDPDTVEDLWVYVEYSAQAKED